MRNSNNWLASIFDWLGDALERFNPSAFRFLAASLPYLTPVPVAWLTAHSASDFLHFTPQVAFIFVFALEGIGLWFTTMLVDSIVAWVRSKNWKSFVPVALFSFTVYAYVLILVTLNVTLESASGNINPALSKVITLMCYLPLITGIGNGYYKLQVDHKTDTEVSKQHSELLEAQIRKEKSEERLEKLRIKYGTSGSKNGSSRSTSESNMEVPEVIRKTSESLGRPSIYQERVFSYMEENYMNNGIVPTFTEVMKDLELPESTASRLRNKWIETRQ